MKYTKLFSAIVLSTLMTGCVVVASPSHADFHTKKELSLDASSLSAMDIEAGSGSLIVKGEQGLTEISVTADIYTDSKYKDNFELTLTKSGSTGFLVAKTKSSSGFWVGNSPHIDVVVHVPASLMLDVNDGSGNTEISDILGNLDINDGSGELRIENIGGNVDVNDGSGELDIYKVDGSLNIVDGSGDIDIKDVGGNLSINDGSGTIYVKQIGGSAEIDDGSGDLTVKQVTGTVTVDDGSGDIHVEDAGGLKILESGSGGLKVNNVKGDFQIDS